ncbi:hypothetical protein BC829DRAFT_385018 [Chytridium lagenaria]|nr:hypothetical protein BC829DRAFT_385018 [Chytridium lagenaria]
MRYAFILSTLILVVASSLAVLAAPIPVKLQEVLYAQDDDDADAIRTPPFVDWDQYDPQPDDDEDDGAIRTPPFRPIPPKEKNPNRGKKVRVNVPGHGVLHVLHYQNKFNSKSAILFLESDDGKVELVTLTGRRARILGKAVSRALTVDAASKRTEDVQAASINRGNKAGDELPLLPIKDYGRVYDFGVKDGDMNILPIKDADGEVNILPIDNDGEVDTLPIDEDGEVGILPIKDDGDVNILPINNDGEVSILPIDEDGEVNILPFNDDGEVNILPITDDGDVNILPINDGGDLHILPIGKGKDERTSSFADEDGEVSILPIKEGDEVHILPIKDEEGKMDGKARIRSVLEKKAAQLRRP